MGQDEIYLQVIATSGEGKERKNAAKVLKLLQRGKHWVLVTLLLGNVITNETLPIVLDRSLGGGWPAVLSSTVLIVIFGEIVPQSICVRYGLPVGAFCAPLVLCLMWLLAPIAWPTAKLLDKLLGKDQGTMYKKSGLKTLVTLHRTLGEGPDQKLNQDEVTIISAVLDLKEKPVGSIMTPMSDVFTLSADAVLDEPMMDHLLNEGYSRIPIYEPENPSNFVGMLLVKMLITYDPEDCLHVHDFNLATLPETRPDTSCLDIMNFFQEGKSHMVLVSEFPGEPHGAQGVCTLEDVIEELIGEEIIDESDVFVDVHKAIRRMAPAPRFRVPKGEVVTAPEPGTQTQEEGEMSEAEIAEAQAAAAARGAEIEDAEGRRSKSPMLRRLQTHPGNTEAIVAPGSRKSSLNDEHGRHTTFLLRRTSSGGKPIEPMQIKGNAPEMRDRLRNLGPKNRAAAPTMTRINTVKIKPGIGVVTIPENKQLQLNNGTQNGAAAADKSGGYFAKKADDTSGERQGLLQRESSQSADGDASNRGRSYGTLLEPSDPMEQHRPSQADIIAIVPAETTQTHTDDSSGFPKLVIDKIDHRSPTPSPPSTPKSDTAKSQADSTLGELQDRDQERAMSSVYGSSAGIGRAQTRGSRSSSHASAGKGRQVARSGSLSESTVDLGGGVKKIVLEMSSSNEDVEGEHAAENGESHGEGVDGADEGVPVSGKENGNGEGAGKKKKRRKRAGKKKGGKDGEGEPLLGEE